MLKTLKDIEIKTLKPTTEKYVVDADGYCQPYGIEHTNANHCYSDDLRDVAREWIKELKDKCIDLEHNPNEFMYCGCQDELIDWIRMFFNLD